MASESEPLIVLGDLLDSAIAVTPSGNILKMGNLAELKSHNLDNLLQCRDNPNIHLMFGNRDLNKLKVLPLTQVSLSTKITNSNINLNKPTYLIDNNGNMYDYLTLASLLKQNINDKVWKWTIPDLKHWYPFWKKNNSDSAEYKLWQAGRHSESDTVMTCLERFFLIFGADNKDGTMSAHNLLYCIPYEVLNEQNKKGNATNKNFNTAFPIFSDMIGKTAMNLGDYKSVLNECNSNLNLMNELELASALVLIVFMRLLMKKKKENNLKYDGLLYDLYTSPRTYFCAFANNTKKLLAFSHGGITKNLLDTKYDKKYNMFFSTKKTEPSVPGKHPKTRKNTYNDFENYNIMTQSKLQGNNLSGGFYKKLNINNSSSPSSSNIHNAISYFNANNKHLLKNTLDYYNNDYNKPTIKYAPSPDLVKLLAMSSGFNTCVHDRYTECNRSSQPNIPFIDSAAYSPIIPGIVGLRSPYNTLYCNDSDFVQFIGHSPQGFGVTIDLFKSTSAEVKFKTYNINLDISNTTLAHDKVADLTKLKDNYLFMVYNTKGELYTHCKLHVANTDKFSKFPDKTITYDSEYNLFSNDFEESLHEIEPDNNNGFIHGKLKDSNLVFYSKVSNYDYTPVLEKKFGFDNETTKIMTAYETLPTQAPFSQLIKNNSKVANAALYGGKRKTKRSTSKKYKRAQTKKLKRK